MLRDSIDLRKNSGSSGGKLKVRKILRTYTETLRKNGKLKLADLVVSIRKGPSMDFAARTPSMLSPRGPQISRFRPGGPQLCGHGSLDAQMDERHSYENRMMYISLPQRPLGHDSITLGQGGLVRGMTSGSQPSAYSSRMAEISSPGDARRVGPGLTGFSSIPERAAYGQREDPMPRYVSERFVAPSRYDQLVKGMLHMGIETQIALMNLCLLLHLLVVPPSN